MALENYNPPKYHHGIGPIKGYLHSDTHNIAAWLNDIAEKAKSSMQSTHYQDLQPSVFQMKLMLESDKELRLLVKLMIEEGEAVHRTYEPYAKYSVTIQLGKQRYQASAR